MSIRRLALAALALLTPTACTGETASTSTDAQTSRAGSPSSSVGPGSGSTPAAPSVTCAEQTSAGLSAEQKAAQLILVAMTPSTVGTASAQIAAGSASGVFLLGGWTGIDATAEATAHIHQLSEETGGIGTWVAIDQEGGEIQQLTGSGVAEIPSAVTQGGMDPQDLQTEAKIWATSLVDAGTDINLAPVADVVPADIGSKNAPIGLYGRQYGSTPEQVTGPVVAFMKGMQDAGVIPTVKHFPGIGRILGNTDTTATGISDETTTADDPALQPFQAAIDAGAPIIMVSTALYPKLDPLTNAAFSGPIITDLLRTQMGFGGVVISDDLGVAESVADTPVDERLTKFLDAGGDVVLTAQPAQAATMNDAAVKRYSTEPAFAAKLDDAVQRVLTLKDEHGLLPCSP